MSLKIHCDAEGCSEVTDTVQVEVTHHLWATPQTRQFCSWRCLEAWAKAGRHELEQRIARYREDQARWLEIDRAVHQAFMPTDVIPPMPPPPPGTDPGTR